ncbi:hypothetical protein GGR52DRAFT_539455 [Hypoxylon sp. FL1284]|nr:hypothetical protein GGR52DRAFT_539455 [Hypoxylon sp. FL1284]
MKFSSGPLFATLALTASLPSVLAASGFGGPRNSVGVFGREMANNGTAADMGKGQDDNNKDGKDKGDKGKDDKMDKKLEKELEDAEKKYGLNIDQNDLQGSLQQNIQVLVLGMGICNLDLRGLSGLGVNDQVQLLLQLQQLQQLQQLGLVSSASVEQLLQQELVLNNFQLNILKRTISASVKQGARESKRTVTARKECRKNKGI